MRLVAVSIDVNQTDYRNEGHSYRWHCNSYEVIFYDKIRDLEKAQKSSKRALEKDNLVQLELFGKLIQASLESFAGQRKRKKKFEVLRMEVRLNKRQKINKNLVKMKPLKLELLPKLVLKNKLK